ncbi:ribosomal protein S5 domain 2-type protein [Amylostereum chailletii]|nr:ribosomal protein S5 domain 2-type protein [Amylostereum chailletii]
MVRSPPSSRIEILNAGGFRSDGRRQYELRATTFDLAPHAGADGAARVSHGLTHVLATVFGPREAKQRAQTAHDRASVHVEVLVPVFGSGERRRRGRGDKRTLELAATLKSTFEAAIQTALYPRAQIELHVHILHQDGSVLAAALNACTLALAAAGIPLRELVCAVSAGAHAAAPLLDLTALEEQDVPHLTVAVLPRAGTVVLASMETRLHVDRFAELFALAGEAGTVLHREMRRAVGERTTALVDAMGVGRRREDAMEEDE